MVGLPRRVLAVLAPVAAVLPGPASPPPTNPQTTTSTPTTGPQTVTWLNHYDDTSPDSNPLAGLPALPKVHHSWPIHSFGADGGWPRLSSSNALLLDYARITHALPLDLNYHSKLTEATVREVVHTCAKANASLSLNWSPFITFCQPECRDPTRWGPEEQREIEFFRSQLGNVTVWLRRANAARPAQTPAVTVGAVLIDQEAGWSGCVNASKPDPTSPTVIAINTKNDLVYNASKEFFPEADVEQYGRGAIRRCSGLGDWSHDPAHAKLCWLSTSVAVWQGLARGPGNEDVHPVGCGYTLQERGDSFNPQFYVSAAALFWLFRNARLC